MIRILPLLMVLLFSSCNGSSTSSQDLVRPVAPTPAPAPSEQGPQAQEQAPQAQAPQAQEQAPQFSDEAPQADEEAQQTEPEVIPVRNINGTITLIWNALFPKAYAADMIHVYRFKTEREYEYLSSHEVSPEGKFSIDLQPSATNGYMLHLVLEEEHVKKGMREKIISGDFDQTITLDSFETIKSQIDLRWFFEQNVLRNEVLADAASNPEDLKGVSAEDLTELVSMVDEKFAETKSWDELTKPEAFSALKKVLQEELADEIVGLGKGQMTKADFFNKVKNKKSKKNKGSVYFGSCTFRPMDQEIITEDGKKSKDKLELRYVPLNDVAKKFMSDETRLAFERSDEILELMKEFDMKIEHFRKNVGEEIHYRLMLVDKESKSSDNCDYQY